ncbi:MAG: hypothetical protein OES57_16770 [Acidimicrobiia bacterium]|nr:hypothetical protein [Acidimicrobiia bacterium]
MQRWQADEGPDRPWVRRRNRDERTDRSDDGDEVIDLTDETMAAREVNGRDFTFLSRFRSRH